MCLANHARGATVTRIHTLTQIVSRAARSMTSHERIVSAIDALLEERQEYQPNTSSAYTDRPESHSTTNVLAPTLTDRAASTSMLRIAIEPHFLTIHHFLLSG